MAKARAPKIRSKRGGSHGIFGHRPGALVWISGRVSAAGFANAQTRLEEIYELVHGSKPKRVTKPDVVEFLMMGEELAIKVISAERGRLDREAAKAWEQEAAKALGHGAARAGGRG